MQTLHVCDDTATRYHIKYVDSVMLSLSFRKGRLEIIRFDAIGGGATAGGGSTFLAHSVDRDSLTDKTAKENLLR